MSFQDLINSEVPVLVDFSAEWCGPCKMMAPVLQEVSKKMGDKARIVKIDVDQNSKIAESLQVRSVPTLIIFRNGKQLYRQAGVHSANQLTELLQQAAHQ